MSQVRKRRKLSLLTALVTMLTLLAFPTGALAVDIPIDCATDDLQVAIDAASPGDAIVIADSSTCTGNFAVSKLLTIRAATVAGATIAGPGVDGSPVLDVTAGGNVTLQDLTVSGGLNTTGDGGGIHLSSAALTLVRSTVTGNSAMNGGGIWSDGILNITDSFVTSNTASLGGGGIHNISGGALTVTTSEISGNTAEHAAGVLNNGAGDSGSTALFTDSVITGNDAIGSDGEPSGGGGIFNFSFPTDVVKAQLTLTDTEVSNNTSAEGAAGIRNADAEATLDGATVTGNIATGEGGGARTSGAMTVIDSDISNNTSTTSGGGLALDGDGSTLTVTGSTINMNDATSEGGGISVAAANTADVDQSSVTRNTAGAGAGFSNAGTLTVTNSTVSANMSNTQGGGILTSGDLTVTHATIATNDAGIAGEGGGVRVIGVPVVTLTGTILWGNTGGSGADCSGPLASGGYNLVGSTAPPCVYTGDPTDLPPLSDPMPDALGFYGAATEHHPLMTGSDAIDAGGACGLTEDQIAATRPDGPACDVGAIEGLSPLQADDVLLVEPNGRWHIRVPGNPDYTFWYGVPGDIPLFGDWDGDGLDTPGAWRQGPGGGFAYMTNTLPPDGEAAVADFDFFFGIPDDEVFVGDWNGDNVDTLGINRDGHIFLTDTNGTGGAPVPTDYDFFFGVDGDRAFGGDGDGDGKDAVFLYRAEGPGAGFVYYTNETPVGPGAVATTADNFFFGIASDSFVAGDWNRDGVDTAGIFRSSDTTVYLTNTNASGGAPAPTDVQYVWGTAGWFPVAGVHGVG